MTPKPQANRTIEELDNKIDDLLLQFAKGYGALTVTFSGKIGDDTKVFQMPYNTLRKAIKLLVSDESKAITQAMLDMVGEDEKPDMRLGQNAYIYSGAVQYRNELRATQRKALKKNMGLK